MTARTPNVIDLVKPAHAMQEKNKTLCLVGHCPPIHPRKKIKVMTHVVQERCAMVLVQFVYNQSRQLSSTPERKRRYQWTQYSSELRRDVPNRHWMRKWRPELAPASGAVIRIFAQDCRYGQLPVAFFQKRGTDIRRKVHRFKTVFFFFFFFFRLKPR